MSQFNKLACAAWQNSCVSIVWRNSSCISIVHMKSSCTSIVRRENSRASIVWRENSNASIVWRRSIGIVGMGGDIVRMNNRTSIFGRGINSTSIFTPCVGRGYDLVTPQVGGAKELGLEMLPVGWDGVAGIVEFCFWYRCRRGIL